MQTTNPFDDDKLRKNVRFLGFAKQMMLSPTPHWGFTPCNIVAKKPRVLPVIMAWIFAFTNKLGMWQMSCRSTGDHAVNGFAAIGHNRYATSVIP